jgi:hypothetical protein
MISRRGLLSGAAVTVPSIALAGCATMVDPVTTSSVYSILTYIQSAVSSLAKYVPTIEAITALAAVMVPGGLPAVTIGSAIITQLIRALASLTPPAGLMSVARSTLRRTPMTIGVLYGVVITGYR